jgi:hypothetical protein
MKCPLTSLVKPTDMLQEHYTCHAKAWSDRINQTIKKTDERRYYTSQLSDFD